MRTLGVFLGATLGHRVAHQEATVQFAQTLAAQGLELVYGGGGQGLMGLLADSALEAGVKVVGVIPRGLVEREMAHIGLSELIVVESMFERKRIMLERADAFVGLPGGFGTLDEVFETVTASQVGVFSKPTGLLNVDGFYDPLLAWVERAIEDGLVRSAAKHLLIASSDANDLLERLLAWRSVGEIKLR